MIESTIIEEEGTVRLSALLIPMGEDLLVVLSGGKAHIGAVAMATPRPSLADPSRTSATSSVFNYVGHKDDAVARPMSDLISTRLERKVVVVAGVHWDDVTQDDIHLVMKVAKKLTEKIIETMKGEKPC